MAAVLTSQLEKLIVDADGRYLEDQELSIFDRYVDGYAKRLHLYEQLQSNSDQLIMQALGILAKTYPDMVRAHAGKCKQDMSHVLRYMALAMLRDDELSFKENVLFWFDTVLLAYKHHRHSAAAYRALQQVIAERPALGDVRLLTGYFDAIAQAFSAHV